MRRGRCRRTTPAAIKLPRAALNCVTEHLSPSLSRRPRSFEPTTLPDTSRASNSARFSVELDLAMFSSVLRMGCLTPMNRQKNKKPRRMPRRCVSDAVFVLKLRRRGGIKYENETEIKLSYNALHKHSFLYKCYHIFSGTSIPSRSSA